jgi:hypothetical protein
LTWCGYLVKETGLTQPIVWTNKDGSAYKKAQGVIRKRRHDAKKKKEAEIDGEEPAQKKR